MLFIARRNAVVLISHLKALGRTTPDTTFPIVNRHRPVPNYTAWWQAHVCELHAQVYARKHGAGSPWRKPQVQCSHPTETQENFEKVELDLNANFQRRQYMVNEWSILILSTPTVVPERSNFWILSILYGQLRRNLQAESRNTRCVGKFPKCKMVKVTFWNWSYHHSCQLSELHENFFDFHTGTLCDRLNTTYSTRFPCKSAKVCRNF